MNIYSNLLRNAVKEIGGYLSQTDLKDRNNKWELLKERINQAATCETDEEAEMLIRGISYTITDIFPITESFAPSFEEALGKLRDKERRLRRSNKKSAPDRKPVR